MATLVINRSESRCEDCPRGQDNALPQETGHFTVSGWHGQSEGCGAPWTAVTSDYVGGAFDNIEEHYFGFDHLRGLPVVVKVRG